MMDVQRENYKKYGNFNGVSQESESSHLLSSNLYINLACLSVFLFVCLFVCLYPINVKTAEPIGPKFFVGHLGTPGMVLDDQNFKNSIFIKFRKSTIFF